MVDSDVSMASSESSLSAFGTSGAATPSHASARRVSPHLQRNAPTPPPPVAPTTADRGDTSDTIEVRSLRRGTHVKQIQGDNIQANVEAYLGSATSATLEAAENAAGRYSGVSSVFTICDDKRHALSDSYLQPATHGELSAYLHATPVPVLSRCDLPSPALRGSEPH